MLIPSPATCPWVVCLLPTGSASAHQPGANVSSWVCSPCSHPAFTAARAAVSLARSLWKSLLYIKDKRSFADEFLL